MTRRRGVQVLAMCVVVVSGLGALPFVVAAAPKASPSAARKAITGRLDRPGYTVIAIAADGTANTTVARDGSFSLVPPADVVTLHLRAPDGVYAGPIVLRERGDKVKLAKAEVTKANKNLKQARKAVTTAQRALKRARGVRARRTASKRLKLAKARLKKASARLKKAKRQLKDAEKQVALRARWAVVGVRPGAALGPIKVDAARGYALAGVVGSQEWKTRIDSARVAQAKGGVPIGAGNFGFVVSSRRDGAAVGDTDLDGIPNTLDIAAGGDLVLNNFKTSTTAHAAWCCTSDAELAAKLWLSLEDTVNANAPATLPFLETKLSTFGLLQIAYPGGTTAELDCGARIYCEPHSKGGTGTVAFVGQPPPLWPECCDPDGNGLGTMNLAAFQPGGPGRPADFFLAHGATTAQVGTGDALIERVTGSDGTTTNLPMTLQDVFATVPALISYHDGPGTNARNVTYPLPPPYTGSPPGPNTTRDGFPVAPCGASDPPPCVPGHVMVTLKFWRPQRKPIPPDANGNGGDACLKDNPPCQWIDIGQLQYWAYIEPTPDTCPRNALSTTDPALSTETTPYIGVWARKDSNPDQTASPTHTLTITVDLTECLASHGLSWNAHEGQIVRVGASNGHDDAEQRLYFVLQ